MKGAIGEDLIASILVIMLLFIFILSAFQLYSNYISETVFIEQQRTASSIAEYIFLNNATIPLSQTKKILNPVNRTNIKVEIRNLETDQIEDSINNIENELETQTASSSLAVLLYDDINDKYYPGKVNVYVAR